MRRRFIFMAWGMLREESLRPNVFYVWGMVRLGYRVHARS
jgi:hypothetical protein